MARRLVVTNGKDPLTKPILEYLDAEYDIDPRDVQRVQLDSEVNQIQTITVTLLVKAPANAVPEPSTTRPPRAEGPADYSRPPGPDTPNWPHPDATTETINITDQRGDIPLFDETQKERPL